MPKRVAQPVSNPADEATKGQRTRARILDSACRLFIEQGYHATSMREIAKGAEIALGGIYNHFSNKDEIFEAVLEQYHPWREIPGVVAAAEGSSVEELVRDAASRLQAVRRERPELLKLHLIELLEFQGRHLPGLFETHFARLTEAAQCVASRVGSSRPGSAAVLSRAFMGLFFAYFMTDGMTGISGLQLPQAGAFDYFTDAYLQGLLAQERHTRKRGQGL